MKRIILLLLLLAACISPQEVEPAFSILGKWQGMAWYCSNTNSCGTNVVDTEAYMTFRIDYVAEDGRLTVSDGLRYVPSCMEDPRCTSLPWEVDSASYINNRLYISWSWGHVFDGQRYDNKFVGEVNYIIPNMSYVWSKEAEIIRIW